MTRTAAPSVSGMCVSAVLSSLIAFGASSVATADDVVARVGATLVRESDVEFLMISRRIPEKQRPAVREKMIDRLIERQLVRNYLAGQNVEVDEKDIEERVQTVTALIRRNGDDPDEVLSRLGFDEERLKTEVSFTLEWEAWLDQVITEAALKTFFEENRASIDGTTVHLFQIFRKAKTESEQDAAAKLLTDIKQQIASMEISFEDAAKQHSQSPTSKRGGDLGHIPWSGRLPSALSVPAFKMKAGEISEPISTRFGVHLLKVAAIKPGQYSLEDVRTVVRKRLAERRWNQLIEQQKNTVKIERTSSPE